MVFHRFLDGEGSVRRSLSIMVNGERLEAWDPFARTNGDRDSRAAARSSTRTNAPVVVRPYVLPSQAHFSSPQAHAARWSEGSGTGSRGSTSIAAIG